MRHKIAGRQLNRTSEHRIAMKRNMAASLIQHETISTTIQKAKELRPFAEKLITLAKKGDLASRRRAIAIMGGNKDIIDYEDGQRVRKGTVVGKLFSDLGPRYMDRPGGYTRIIRLALRRLGDNGELVLLQLLGEGEKYQPKQREKKAEPKPRSEPFKEEAESVANDEENPEVAEEKQSEQKAEDQGREEDQQQEQAEQEKE